MFARRFRATDRPHQFPPVGPGGSRIGRRNPRMSLINDALKRASKSPPPPPVDSGAPFRPAEQPRRSPVIVPAISLIALVIFGLAGWFLYRGWQASRAAAASDAKISVAARENAEARRPGSLATNQSSTSTARASTKAPQA